MTGCECLIQVDGYSCSSFMSMFNLLFCEKIFNDVMLLHKVLLFLSVCAT